MKWHRLGTILIAFWMTCLTALAATVRGKLLQTVASRQIPAGGISVTLLDNQKKAQSFAVSTDASGLYSFQNVRPGDYTVQIWRPGKPMIPYNIHVSNTNLDVNPLALP